MKRFYQHVTVADDAGGWRVLLDGRGIKTAQQRPQIVPHPALAAAMATEWQEQGDIIDPAAFPLRSLADHAIDVVGTDRRAVIRHLLSYGESDSLCYRAEPGEALWRRQLDVWEPLLARAEARWGLRFVRVSGVIHHAQHASVAAGLEGVLAAECAFTLSALNTLASLAASLVIALAALEPDADADGLWNAANLEEDWQAQQWGWDDEARSLRARRLAEFATAMRFVRLVRPG